MLGNVAELTKDRYTTNYHDFYRKQPQPVNDPAATDTMLEGFPLTPLYAARGGSDQTKPNDLSPTLREPVHHYGDFHIGFRCAITQRKQ